MVELTKLVQRAQGGNLDAYGALVQRFQGMAMGYAQAQLGDYHLAEDTAQEAFVHAYLNLDKLREPAAFPGWLRRIVATCCNRQHRRQRVATVPLDGPIEIAATDPTPVGLLEQKERRQHLQRAVMALPEQERTVTQLFYYGGIAQKDIAAFLDLPLTTVKYRLLCARKRLEQTLTTDEEFKAMATKPMALHDAQFATKIQDHLQTLETLHDDLAARVQILFSETLDREITVAIGAVEQISYSEFVHLLPERSCTYQFRIPPLKGRIVLDLGMELACGLVDHLAGIEGSEEGGLRTLAFSEYWMLNPTVARLLGEDIEGTWEGVLPIKTQEIELETYPRCLLDVAADPEHTVIHVDLAVRGRGLAGSIRMCYPVATLAAVLPLLAAGAPVAPEDLELPAVHIDKRRLTVDDIADLEVRVVPAGPDQAYILENLYPIYWWTTADAGDLPNTHGLRHPMDVRDHRELCELYMQQWWERPNAYHPLLIFLGDRPVGFTIVNSPPAHPGGIQYELGEIFLPAPLRDKGIIEQVIPQIIDRFTGRWEICVDCDDDKEQALYRTIISGCVGCDIAAGTGISALFPEAWCFQFDNGAGDK